MTICLSEFFARYKRAPFRLGEAWRPLIVTIVIFSSVSRADAQINPSLPLPSLTPGDIFPVSRDEICRAGYAKDVRHVSGKVKHKVFAEYGIKSHKAGEYEVDHLISLELGGSNDIKNLWPEPFGGTWNAHDKDKLEDKLHKEVCRGKIPLIEAQHAIASNWIAAYGIYVKHDKKAPAQ